MCIRLFALFSLAIILTTNPGGAQSFFTSSLTTDSTRLIRAQNIGENNDNAIQWAVNSGQRPLVSHASRLSKRRAPNSKHDVAPIIVTQSGSCWNISWQKTSSKSPILNYRIYQSRNDRSFALIATVSDTETSWEHCCKADGVDSLKYGISVVESPNKENPMQKSERIIVASSFVPTKPLPFDFRVPYCCVENHAIAYNSIDDNFLLVFDCAEISVPTQLKYVVINGNGQYVTKIKDCTISLGETISDQGYPTVAFNRATRQFAILLQLRNNDLHNGKYVIVSWLIDGTTGELSGQPRVVVRCTNKNNDAEDCRNPQIIYNPRTDGYIMTMEIISKKVIETIGGTLSSDANFKKVVQKFKAEQDCYHPRVIYEPVSDSFLFAVQVDKKYCEKHSKCSGHAIMIERLLVTGKTTSKCIVGSTWAKSARISLTYDETYNKTIACFTKKEKKGKPQIACYRVGFDEDGGCFALPMLPFCSNSAQNGHVIYYPLGKSIFSAWTETVDDSKSIGGQLLEKKHLGKDVTAPIAIYRRNTSYVCIAYQTTDVCGSIKMQCFKPSSECNKDCCPQKLKPCGLCGNTVCSKNATCTKNLTCRCKKGYRGSGVQCILEDSCSRAGNPCSKNATCVSAENNQPTCHCNKGFLGNGTHCSDVRNCSRNSELKNGKCVCKLGYVGNGKFCCSPKLQDVWNVTEGDTATLSCLRPCLGSYLMYLNSHLNFTWKFRGGPLNKSDSNYRLSEKGAILTVRRLDRKYLGSYTCIVNVRDETNSTTFYGRIDVAPKDGKCKCGSSSNLAQSQTTDKRHKAKRGEIPWQAMLCYKKKGTFCGGVMISRCCVLTAAHCVEPIAKKNDSVKVCLGKECGSCDEDDRHAQCFSTKKIVVHQNYVKETYANDIALIKLDRGECLQCGDYVKPICLPQPTRDGHTMKAGKEAIVSGWGKRNGGDFSKCLDKGSVYFQPIRKCVESFTWEEDYHKFCTTDDTGACEGDSGGPLTVKNSKFNNRWILAGLVSYGYECGSKIHPGVYARVDKYLDWIYENCESL